MFWLSGHTHSGTTLLQTLLDGHRECLVYPVEPYFPASFNRDCEAETGEINQNFLFRLRNQLHCAQEAVEFREKLASQGPLDFDRISVFLQNVANEKKIAKIKLEQFDHSKFFQIYYSSLLKKMKNNPGGDRKFNVDAAFHALQAAVNATVPELEFGSHMVFKQPLGKLRPGALDWFFENWPNGKMVFLTRNPYARIWSHIRHEVDFGRATVRWATDRKAFVDVVKWYSQDYAQSLALPESDRVLKIAYEDLVTRTGDTMTQVCRFFGIAHCDSCLVPSVFGYATNPTTNRTGRNTVNASSLHKWKDNLTAVEKAVIGSHIAKARARRFYRPQSAQWRDW